MDIQFLLEKLMVRDINVNCKIKLYQSNERESDLNKEKSKYINARN